LIELTVALLIITILLAIAIPTFLGERGSADDRSAQAVLTNALARLRVLNQKDKTYCEVNCGAGVTALPLTGVGGIQSSAPEFTWSNGSTAVIAGNNVSVQPIDVTGPGLGDGVIVAALSNNNTCWYAVDLEATPQAAFAGGDTGNSQFVGAAAATTVGAQWESVPTAQAPMAGVYYSKVLSSNGICNAAVPLATGSGAWLWGTSFSNAPAS